MEEEKVRKFVFVAEGEVFFVIGIPENDQGNGVIAGMHSNPQIIEVEDNSNIHYGTRYIDGEFYNRVDTSNKHVHLDDDYEVED